MNVALGNFVYFSIIRPTERDTSGLHLLHTCGVVVAK